MRNVINVLMVGSDLSVKGGMTTVVKAFLKNNFKDVNIKYIPTHIEKNIILKIIFFSKSIIKTIIALIFGKVDIVHIHLSERGSFFRKYIIFYLSKIFKKKIIVHMHGAEFKEFFYNSSRFIKNMIIKLMKKSSKVIVLGKSWDEFVKQIDISIETKIIRNSVRYPNEVVVYETEDIRILFLAVLTERKGIFDLIKAAEILLASKNMESYNIKFIIGGSGKEEIKAKEEVNKRGMDKYFEFKGWVNDNEKIELLKTSQIFVLPSYNEGLPVAILEAMSYGLPIISTNVGSIEDAVIDNYNGYIIKPGDICELKNSMEKCIVLKELWNKFSQNSKGLIREYYNELNYFDEMQQIYVDLVRGDK